MLTSSFSWMAASLDRLPRAPWPMGRETAAPEARGSRTEQIRQLLRERGALTAVAIAVELDLTSASLVGALLKADLHAGRAFHQDGHYHWNQAFDEQQARAIAEAINLLKKHGYSVERAKA